MAVDRHLLRGCLRTNTGVASAMGARASWSNYKPCGKRWAKQEHRLRTRGHEQRQLQRLGTGDERAASPRRASCVRRSQIGLLKRRMTWSDRITSTSCAWSDVLPKHLFLRELEREKRRTDRSKTSLSIALFHIEGKKTDELGQAEAAAKDPSNQQARNGRSWLSRSGPHCASPSRHGRGGDTRHSEEDRQSNRDPSSS